MKLRDIFKKAFWAGCWDKTCDGIDNLGKATIDGLAAHGRATCGLPPWDTTPKPAEEPKPPAGDKKPQQPAGPGL